MTPEQYQRLEEIFFKALDCQTAERTNFIEKECKNNIVLINSVKALISSHKKSDNFLDSSVLSILSDKENESILKDFIFDDEPTSVLPPPPSKLPHYRFGKFEIQTEVGKGGMAVVYKAFDLEMKKIIALKLISENLSDNYRILRRFKSEGLILSKLSNENIVKIHEQGIESGIPFISMEFLNGYDLDNLIKKKKLANLKDKLDILIQVSLAIRYIHSSKIVHRDIKPKNVMVLDDGLVKLMDFGIAKQVDAISTTGNGNLIGTVAYMSPEQLTSGEIGCSSDIFSFGVMACEIFTGRRPFDGPNIGMTISNVLNVAPVVRLNQSGLENLKQVILRSLQKDHKKRPAIDEIHQELELLKKQ